MTTPLVTVLMAVYNGADYLEQAVESILRQTFTKFEFLIIDDGSTDDTPERLASFEDPRIRVVRNPTNVGLTRSLNRGLEMARGALIARQDVDDVSHETRLHTQVDFLQREHDVVVLGTQARFIDSQGRSRNVPPWPKLTSKLAIRWQLMFDGPFIHTSVMFRKAVVWDELRGYDESFTTAQDFELWSRVGACGYAMRNVPAKLVDFRVHDGSVSTRYTLERVIKLRPVFLNTLVGQLGPDSVPEGWPDTWIRATYPGVLPDSGNTVADTMAAVDLIYDRFVSVYPDAANDREIRQHMAAILIRLARHATQHYWVRSIAPFIRACRLDPMMTAQVCTGLPVGRL